MPCGFSQSLKLFCALILDLVEQRCWREDLADGAPAGFPRPGPLAAIIDLIRSRVGRIDPARRENACLAAKRILRGNGGRSRVKVGEIIDESLPLRSIQRRIVDASHKP